MKRIIVLLFFLLLLSTKFFAQQSYIDSLKNELKNSENDTLNLVLYSLLCMSYQSKNYDSALLYSRKQFQLAQKLDYKLDQAYALDNIGYNMYYLSVPGSLQMLLKGAEIAENPEIEKKVLPEKYWNRAVYFEAQALTEAKKKPLNVRLQILASLNQDIGHVYGNDFGNRQKQLFYYFKAVAIAEGVNDKYSLILNYNTIANTYLLLNKLDSGLLYGQKAYDLAVSSGLGQLSVHTSSILGNIYFEKKDYPIAMDYVKKAIHDGIKYNTINGVVQANLILSKIFSLNGAIDSSFFYARRGYKTAKEANSPQSILSATDVLVKLYASTNNVDSAFKYLQLSYALKDNVYSSEKVKQIQRLDFEEQEKQKEIEASKLKFENRLKMYSLLGGLLTLLAISIMLLRNNRNRQKAFALLQKQKQEIDVQKTKVEQTLDELKTTQSQLIQSEKMASLGELTAGIAHEIQNPLNFVNNFSEVNKELLTEMKDEMNKGNIDDANAIANDVIDNEEKINHHGKRADAIVKGMLQHSRSSSGVKELTDINALADEYLRLAYHGLRAKDKTFNATMKTDYDESIGNINIIPQDIGRVILNLITNAFYAVTQKKKQNGDDYEPIVSVSTKKINNTIQLTVKDNGNGIPQKVIDKIFQPFFTTKPTGEGTGLGLSLSYDIMKAHGGDIKVETKEGEGSEFIIQIPLNKV
jgi:two-component system NtrC family sensor kinase